MSQDKSDYGIRRNLIFITVDSLRYDRLGCAGHEPGPSPNIDRMMKSGLGVTNCFVTGCPTTFSIPMIFTSTLPLDKGGSEYGIRARETSLAQVMKQAGYKTVGYRSGIALGKYWGLDIGFDDFFLMTDLPLILRSFRHIYVRNVKNAYKFGRIDLEDCYRIMAPALMEFFDTLDEFCAKSATDIGEKEIYLSPVTHRWDLEGLAEYSRKEREKFRSNQEGYIIRLLETDPLEKIFELSRFEVAGIEKLKSKLTVGAEQVEQQTSIVSAGYVFDNLRNWITSHHKDGPFFAWAHLMDAHYSNFTSFDTPDAEKRKGRELEIADKLFRQTRSMGGRYKGDPLYDLSIQYVDDQVGHMLKFLSEQNLLENTMIVVTSDHGSFSARWPVRHDYDIDRFFDELYHVPAVIYSTGSPVRKIEGLVSAMDIAPTVLDLLGIKRPTGFTGKSFADGFSKGREYVVMEHLGRGPSDFETKTINVCVRSDTYKVVYRAPALRFRKDGEVSELYDLERDPMEMENIKENASTLEGAVRLIEAARSRVDFIRTANELYFHDGTDNRRKSSLDGPPADQEEIRLRMKMYNELVGDIEELRMKERNLQQVCDERMAVIETLNNALQDFTSSRWPVICLVRKAFRKLFG